MTEIGTEVVQVILILALLLSVGAGILAFLAVRHWPQADPALAATEAIGTTVRRHGRVRRALRARLDPAAATGLALTAAVAGLVVAGTVVGILAWMVRRETGFVDVDHAAERWADTNATALSDAVLAAMTHLGDTVTVIAVGVALAAFGLWRWRRISVVLFVAAVVLGQALLSNTMKVLIDRARPELRPRAVFTGTSFPSGHTTAAAATYLAVAVVLTIAASPRARAGLVAGAVAIGVAVACTRVLLGVHWLSDTLAGLAIGWAWFGLCAVAFGGRIMRFGAPARLALAPVDRSPPEAVPTTRAPAPRRDEDLAG